MPDSICPTFASGTFSLISGSLPLDLVNDQVSATGANGYTNTIPDITAGSFNHGWTNKCNTQSVTPTFSSSLVDFGNTGRQS